MNDNEHLNVFRNRWVLLAMVVILVPLAVEIERLTRDTLAPNVPGAIALILTGLLGLYLAITTRWDE